jgi:hypothetical protein
MLSWLSCPAMCSTWSENEERRRHSRRDSASSWPGLQFTLFFFLPSLLFDHRISWVEKWFTSV